jgi:hypothetical protein
VLVLTTHPQSPQAYVARVSAAALRLEHLGDPAGALRLYGSGSGGPLTPEIAWGKARAHRALGQTASERRELEALASGSSSLAEAARERLKQIGAHAAK